MSLRISAATILLLFACLMDVCPASDPQSGEIHRNLPYRPQTADLDEYAQSQCRLDLYVPKDVQNFPTIIWFHGGGLTGGKRFLPQRLLDQGIAVAAVSYRLSPRVKVAQCVDDAAAAVAWVFKNIERYGGSPEKIIVSGHSAGGYLTSMVGLDKHWLAAYDIDADKIAGLAPFSTHTVTHFTARKEQGIPQTQPTIDELAPLTFVRSDAPPILLLTGDRDMEILGRYEENAYFWRMLKVVGHPDVTLYEFDGYGHGNMPEPGYPLLLKFTKRICEK